MGFSHKCDACSGTGMIGAASCEMCKGTGLLNNKFEPVADESDNELQAKPVRMRTLKMSGSARRAGGKLSFAKR